MCSRLRDKRAPLGISKGAHLAGGTSWWEKTYVERDHEKRLYKAFRVANCMIVANGGIW